MAKTPLDALAFAGLKDIIFMNFSPRAAFTPEEPGR
jgi:hypothetical protein